MAHVAGTGPIEPLDGAPWHRGAGVASMDNRYRRKRPDDGVAGRAGRSRLQSASPQESELLPDPGDTRPDGPRHRAPQSTRQRPRLASERVVSSPDGSHVAQRDRVGGRDRGAHRRCLFPARISRDVQERGRRVRGEGPDVAVAQSARRRLEPRRGGDWEWVDAATACKGCSLGCTFPLGIASSASRSIASASTMSP